MRSQVLTAVKRRQPRQGCAAWCCCDCRVAATAAYRVATDRQTALAPLQAGTPRASPKRPATSPRGGWWGGGAPFDARAGSDSCQGNGPAAEAAAVLPGLPVEVLELIGRHLSLQGR